MFIPHQPLPMSAVRYFLSFDWAWTKGAGEQSRRSRCFDKITTVGQLGIHSLHQCVDILLVDWKEVEIWTGEFLAAGDISQGAGALLAAS